MASRSPQAYLERKRVFLPRSLHGARFATLSQRSHRRPIVHHPDTLPEDTVDRVKTQKEKRRVPYHPVLHPRPDLYK